LASAIESAETSTDVNRASGLRWARVTVVAAALAVALAAPLLQRPATVTHGPGTSVQPPGTIGRTEPTAVKVLAEAALLLDPATGALLGARSVLTREVPGWRLAAGTVTDEGVFLKASVVDSRAARPGSRAQAPRPR